MNQNGKNELNRINVDRVGLKWTKLDQFGLDKTELIEYNFSGQSGPNKTSVDRIRILNIYYFYSIFRAHISNF